MEKFIKNPICRKCSYKEIYINYYPPRIIEIGTHKLKEEPEYLRLKCKRCEYAWITECMDAQA